MALATERIFLDANILMELLFNRDRTPQVETMLAAHSHAQFYLSVLTIDLVLYFVEIKKTEKSQAWSLLEKYEPLDITVGDISWARDNDHGDFEDALQVACAWRSQCTAFVTLDKKLFQYHHRDINIQLIS